MELTYVKKLFYIDYLALIIVCLVSYIGLLIFLFSKNYLRGDSRYKQFLFNLSVLILGVFSLAIVDNMVLFLSIYLIISLVLVKLIIHKPTWKAARFSGIICQKFFITGIFFIGLGFSILYKLTDTLSIQGVLQYSFETKKLVLPLSLILIGVLIQSAIWPFHKWLISSLNSPTPVSAIMHAGIINGGGFILARFASLYFKVPSILTMMFIFGLSTSFVGTTWKLVQNDIKRTLASSTMAQMGFMIVQCGLGLFPAAVAHLFCHGLFKAYLFLNTGNSLKEIKIKYESKPSAASYLLGLSIGILASYIFSYASSIPWLTRNTTNFLILISFIVSSELAISILTTRAFKNFFKALVVTLSMTLLYGWGIFLTERILHPLNIMHPVTLNYIHYLGMGFILIGWFSVHLVRQQNTNSAVPKWFPSLYVKCLNASQPHSKTITANRKDYKYV